MYVIRISNVVLSIPEGVLYGTEKYSLPFRGSKLRRPAVQSNLYSPVLYGIFMFFGRKVTTSFFYFFF